MEILQHKAKQLLITHLGTFLAVVDQENNQATGAETTTPDMPPESYYTTDLAMRPVFPSCSIFARQGAPKDADQYVEEWRYTLEVEFYQTGIDAQDLMRQINRYCEAAKRILRKPALWAGLAFDPQVAGVYYSNVMGDETGFMRAGRVNVIVTRLESFE